MNIDTLVAAIILFVITVTIAFLNGDCGPGIRSPAILRKALAAPPMNPEGAPADGGFDPDGKPEPSLREVMIELREVKALLQGRSAVAGILPTLGDGNMFARLKMPTWNLGGGEPTPPPATASSAVASERGSKPLAANSTSDMAQQQQGGVCVPGVFASPPPPERKGRSRSKARREREYDDRGSYR